MAERKNPDERKERVIHARIPASLETEIKRMADGLRIPVSNLVRNILEDTVAMVEGVQQNVDSAVAGIRSSLGRLEARVEEAAHPQPEPEAPARPAPVAARAAAIDRVFGWQELILNWAARCAACDRSLARGEQAYFGMTGRPDDRIFICPACVPRPAESTPREPQRT